MTTEGWPVFEEEIVVTLFAVDEAGFVVLAGVLTPQSGATYPTQLPNWI